MRTAKAWVAATASIAAMVVALSGCGSGGGDSAGGASALKVEPPAGVPSSYTGDLPKATDKQRYDNPQPRGNVKQGGTLTLPAAVISPNWNFLCSDAHDATTAEFWNWYMPRLMITTSVGGSPLRANPDYLTGVKQISEDPEVIEYDINPKATWNDGRKMDYTDFQTTWKALSGKDPDYNPAYVDGYDKIASVERGDSDQQVIVTYATPYHPWQIVFTYLMNRDCDTAKLFSQGWVHDPHNEWGAGPYVVQSSSDDQATFVPNPKWWGDKPKLDKVTYKRMDSSAAVNAFRNGEIDATEVKGNDAIKQVRAVKGAQLRYKTTVAVNALFLNGQAAPMNDLKVRKAVTQAFDVKTWNAIRYQGLGWTMAQPGSILLAPSQQGYEDNMPADARHSVGNAKKTLESDGYRMGSDGYYAKGGKRLDITYTCFGDEATTSALATAFQTMMKQAGIHVKIDNRATSKFADALGNGSYEIIPIGLGPESAYDFVSSTPSAYLEKSDGNYSHVGDAEIDRLAKAPGTKPTYEEQAAAANEAEKAAMKLYGVIPTDTPVKYIVAKQGLANYGLSGFAATGDAYMRAADIGWQKS